MQTTKEEMKEEEDEGVLKILTLQRRKISKGVYQLLYWLLSKTVHICDEIEEQGSQGTPTIVDVNPISVNISRHFIGDLCLLRSTDIVHPCSFFIQFVSSSTFS